MRRFSPNSFALGFSMVFLVCPPCLNAVWASLGLSFWCLPPCGLVCQLVSGLVSASLGLSPSLSSIVSPGWSGMLCPPPWSCLPAVRFLQLFLAVHGGVISLGVSTAACPTNMVERDSRLTPCTLTLVFDLCWHISYTCMFLGVRDSCRWSQCFPRHCLEYDIQCL